MPHTLEIKWIDRVAADGGGTRLTIKVDGKSVVNEKPFLANDLEVARELAIRHLKETKFENSSSGPGINV